LQPSSDIETTRYDSQPEQVRTVKDIEQDSETTTTRLNIEFTSRDVPELSSHRSSSTAFKLVVSEKSRQRLYLSQPVAVAKIVSSHPQLSREMLDEVNRLPRWSGESMERYYDFFASYGTHVVTRVALGGVIRVVSQATKSSEACSGDGAPQDLHPVFQHGTAHSQKHQVTIFRDGGGAVASRLTRVLEDKFTDLQEGSSVDHLGDWSDVRMQWIEELQKDPVFCPDDPNTDYQWLHKLGGLTDPQREDLRRASESYLKPSPDEEHPMLFTRNNPEPTKGSAREEDPKTNSKLISRSDMDLNSPNSFRAGAHPNQEGIHLPRLKNLARVKGRLTEMARNFSAKFKTST
jgi:hypothetical protein